MRETKKTRNRKKLARVRYIYPLGMMILLIISMFIPCGSYVTDSDVTKVMSASEQISYMWKTSRQALFGGGEELSGVVKSFEITVLVTIAVTVVLFLTALAFTVYLAYSCFRYMSLPKLEDRQRAIFLTLVPNRVASFVYLALCLPLAAFQRILSGLYSWVLDSDVEFVISFADPFIIGIILFVGGVVLSGVSKKGERIEGIDPFKKMFETALGTEDEKEENVISTQTVSGRYEDITSRAKDEQLEAIRRLLKNNDRDESDD